MWRCPPLIKRLRFCGYDGCQKWRGRCRSGVTRSTGSRWRDSLQRSRRFFRDPRSSMHGSGVSHRQCRGSRSIPIGAPIRRGQTGSPARWQSAAARRLDGRGGSPTKGQRAGNRVAVKQVTASRIGFRQASGFRLRPIGSSATRAGQASAASAVSRSTGSAGMWTCGIAARTGMLSGTPPAWWPGISGRRRATMRVSSSACSADAARKRADACGRPRRSITACRCSAYGASIATRRGRHYSAFGACRTYESSIAMLTWGNAQKRRGFAA